MVSSHCMNLTVCPPPLKKKNNHFLHFINLRCVCVSVEMRGVVEVSCLLPRGPLPRSHLQSLCLFLNWYWCCRNKKENVMLLLRRIKETKKDRLWSEVWSPQMYGGSRLFSSLLTLSVKSTVEPTSPQMLKGATKGHEVSTVFLRSNLLKIK